MTGFSAKGSDLHHDALWATHGEVNGEPFFVLVHQEGLAVGLVTMDYIKECAREVYKGDRQWEDMFRELYFKDPLSGVLEHVALDFSGTPSALKLAVCMETGRLWTVDL